MNLKRIVTVLVVDIFLLQKKLGSLTSKSSKVLIEYGSICNRKSL